MSDAFAQPARSGSELLDALWDIERRCLSNSAGLPEHEALSEIWAGVLFRLGQSDFLAPLEDIGEVLEAPREITPVPGARPWVCGVANNRGTLLPIFDLQAFLYGAPTPRHPKNRVLVVRHEESPFGLLVGDVVGIRHFQESAGSASSSESAGDTGIDGLLTGSFSLGQDRCPVMSLGRLGHDARFSFAAA